MPRNFPDLLQTLASCFFRESRQSLDDTVPFNAIENHLMPSRIVTKMSGELPERDSCAECHGDIIAWIVVVCCSILAF
jgi:hypothetical protein